MLTTRTEEGLFEYEPIESQPCSAEDLARDFFKTAAKFGPEIRHQVPKLKCMRHDGATENSTAPEPFSLFGDLQTFNSQYLSVFYTACDRLNLADCRS